MERGPKTEKEWEQYSSHNIKKLQELPMSELYALGEVLKGIITQFQAEVESNNIAEDNKEFVALTLSVSTKRLNIVTMAKFKKIEAMFDTPKF
ncbi:hypothetical protein [Zobellia sp. 1_MG-2023]|uniref:hypothetical protein n=1 Tax=Zobellia sp. 1_MG-2023 TaxID=3062626 RepID=UPI0026E35FB9|nr:hypothetical protein [Zobellia sp. 1_MG-2023]MDO6821329.1 hypothetical protein [Zobellia sp. 1_MG-2023]